MIDIRKKEKLLKLDDARLRSMQNASSNFRECCIISKSVRETEHFNLARGYVSISLL